MNDNALRNHDEDRDEALVFAPEDTTQPIENRRPPWRILAVDDDEGFQNTTAMALRNMTILGRPLEVVHAFSLAEAARCLAHDRDFAVILADVVMETEDAGLRLVKGVRETLGLFEPRIVLLTGQPGFAPVRRIMEEYDLSDYCLKSDLARRGLKQVLTGVIRGYEQIRQLAAARKGLQLIIESSSRLAAARSIDDLARGALVEIARLIGVAAEEAPAALAFLEQRPVSYPILINSPEDPPDISLTLGNTQSVLPYTALIGRDGRILATRMGNFSEQALDDWITPYL